MILYPHEFELYHGWILKIASDVERIILSGVSRGSIECIKITDYSNDSGTLTKAYATINIAGEISIPNGVNPTSIETYKQAITKEAYSHLNYVFDVDIERGV